VPDVVLATRNSDGIRLSISGVWHNRKMVFEVTT
jgi:hypothetical protein